jgi:multidrug transporter EmrE-like cation transporter
MGAIGLNFSSSATAFLRLACEPFLWIGLFCYGISVVVWILALSRVDVSIAYPMLSMGYVVNAFAAWQLFGETMNPARLIGMGVVLLGVYILARS